MSDTTVLDPGPPPLLGGAPTLEFHDRLYILYIF